MKDDDGVDGAASRDVPPGVRERAIREVCARIDAASARRAPQAEPGRAAPLPTWDGATLRSPPVFPGAAHEGPSTASPAPRPALAPPVSLPKVVQAPAFLTSTERMQDVPPASKGALPAPAPAPPPPRRPAPRTVQSRVRNLGDTTPANDAITKALAALPVPPLTLRQYASLCAELTFFGPDRRGEILARYHVRGEEALEALDAQSRRERATSPEARVAFAEDVASYTLWLHDEHRGSGHPTQSFAKRPSGAPHD